MQKMLNRMVLVCLSCICFMLPALVASAVPYLDNESQYSNQDQETETRRSEHFRFNFGHYNRDSGQGGMTEAMAQGNLQMFEQEWNRIVVELGMHDWNESVNPAYIDGNKYKVNFNALMTWNDGGGGGCYMSMDNHGFAYCMGNPTYLRYDPPSGATPHEMGHVWEGASNGFNGTNSSGMWWECTANWIMLQYSNTYPQCDPYMRNAMFYPAHGRDFYDTWLIWEAAREDPRYGASWVNRVWTDATPDQQVNEFIIDRMIRIDASGSADKAGSMKDLWGEMAKKAITWDYERGPWLKSINKADDGSDWEYYRNCRTPLVELPGASNWYRPAREYTPMEYGFGYIPLSVTAGTTVSVNFQPICDPVRQSDWRACLVAVNSAGESRYSNLWNAGTNSITLSSDESKLYLTVVATPKPMSIPNPMWAAYTSDAGLQFPYALSFTNATPKNVVYTKPSVTWKAASNNLDGSPRGPIQSTATVATNAYVGPNAMVLNTAKVLGNARVEDYAVVRNSAQVYDNAVISGHAVIEGSAKVYGNATVRDWTRIAGYAQIYENAKALEHAYCGDGTPTKYTKILGNAVIKGVTSVYDTSYFTGSLICDGDTANGNGAPGATGATDADHGVHFGWAWGQDPSRFPTLTDNNYIYVQHSFERENAVFAMDQFGINHGFLMNGARVAKDTAAPTRGGRVLPLDGVSQYVELHNSINDFRDTTISVWVKWTGTAADQRIWSMGDGDKNYMYLTAKDGTTSKLRLVVNAITGRKDTSTTYVTKYLDGLDAIPANTWTHVAVTFTGSTAAGNASAPYWTGTATLYVNGVSVASATGVPTPDQLTAPLIETAPIMGNANYLGRGNAGNYFQGYVDDFRVYMKGLAASDIAAIYNTAAPAPVTVLADTTAPTPNGATWLVAPNAISDNAITMSATQGTDASGWVEYYFTCTSGGGHDSGWISMNKYTDVGLNPGTAYTYMVKMRDKNGNTTDASVTASATTQVSSVPKASFAYGPIGTSTTAITMTATKVASPSGLMEYQFTRDGAVVAAWRSSPTFTDTGRASNTSYTYTVQMRDGRGNIGAASDPVAAISKDSAAPLLPIPVAQWQMMPYSTIDNKVCMTAQSVQTTGIQVYYQCVSGGGPDSGWLSITTSDDGNKTFYAKWTTPNALADGTYSYHYKLRDAAGNESPYSTTYSAKITPTTGYHSTTLAQLAGMPDDNLVSFSGTVMKVNAKSYNVKDLATGASIIVKPYNGKSDGTSVETTDSTLALKNVTVKGHLYTYSGTQMVTYSTVTSTGNPTTYAISGKVTSTTGAAIAGATVYFSDVPNASANAVVTATTDASGNYSKGVTNGTWYVCAGSSAYNTSVDQTVTVNGVAVPNINFSLVANATISGRVGKKSDGTAIAGASVYFSKTPNASASPTFTATTDASGNYTQPVQNGTWYISAAATNYFGTLDQTATVNGTNISGVNFALSSSARNIPRTADLLFSAVTESLPASGNTGNWSTYLPSGGTLTAMATPSVDMLGGVKWVKNLLNDGDGYDQGSYSTAIPVSGATIVTVVKPTRIGTGESWTSVVDIFYDRLVLGVKNSSGQINVRRNGSVDVSSIAIPNGQATILSLVVQPDGTYKVYANGTQAMSITSTSDMTSLVPSVAGVYANHINVGRNNPDGWSTYNGDYGDVFVYKVALTDSERLQLEADLANKFGIGGGTTYTITSSAGTGGSITPAGATIVSSGTNQGFVITPNVGYIIADVRVDNVSVGAVSSYTFSNVTANHTISATFSSVPVYTIAATAGTGGVITPSGSVGVSSGGNQSFTITPLTGYTVSDVKVDNVSVGAVTSYMFNGVIANHSIAATFTAQPVTVTGQVTDLSNGAGVSGASVYFSLSPNPSSNPAYTATTNAQGNYSQSVTPGTYYVAVGKSGYDTSEDQTVAATAGSTPVQNFAIAMTPVAGTEVFYKFDETSGTNVADSAGTGKNGTLMNGPVFAAGRVNNCLTFDGTNDYVSVPNLGDYGAITIAGWINLDTLGTDATASSILSCDGSDAGDIQFSILKSGGRVRFSLLGATPADSDSTYAFTSSDFGKWRHVAVVYDSVAKTVKFYINGGLNATKTLTSARLATLSNGVRVGAWSTGRYFDGKMDEFHIYGRALNAAEIAALVTGSSATKIADAKKMANGDLVTLPNKMVIYAPRSASNARSTNYFYIEEPDRTAGLLVYDAAAGQDTLNVDTGVSIIGLMKTMAATGQRYLDLSAIPGSGTTSVVSPLGMITKSLHTDPSAPGLLVRVTGKVKEVGVDGDYMIISDGYAKNGTEVQTVVINETGIPIAGITVGDTVCVTGVSWKDIIFTNDPEGLVYMRNVVKL